MAGGYDLEKINDGLVEANSKFAFEIFRELNREDNHSSVFISPFSITAALTMTYNGAETTTKEAMEKALGFDSLDRGEVNESFQNLLNYLERIDKKIELNIANSIWIREGIGIKEDFLANNERVFQAEIDYLDFSKEASVDAINGWIADATRKKIEKMLEGPIDPSTILFLINAVYFKGQWSEQFDPKLTFDGVFKAYNGEEQTVKMMSRNGKVEYTEGEDYKAVRLPYGSGKVSMYCILPEEGLDILEFLNTLNVEKWNEIRESVREVDDVRLQIPRFKLEYGIKELNDSLIALGMGEAFGPLADFSGMREGLYIDKVLHKAVIEVNEEGSEAAAVTVVVTTESAAIEPVAFVADRPFVFVIADDTTGTILFMGKLLSVEQ